MRGSLFAASAHRPESTLVGLPPGGHSQAFNGGWTDIQYNFSVLSLLCGHINTIPLHVHQQMGSHIVIKNPFVDSTNQVGATGSHTEKDTVKVAR